MKLPTQYIDYVQNGGQMKFEADFDFGGYIILEPLERIDEFNKEIEINEYAPGYLAFASDGGGEAFVFDSEGKIYLMPLVGMSPNDASMIAESWAEYVNKTIT